MDYEINKNVATAVIFRKLVAAGAKNSLTKELASHGVITGVKIRFAAGESGTLHIRPLVVHPGNITVDLLSYADNGDKYVSGDSEPIESDINIEIERKSKLVVEYENTGTAESFVNVDIEVTYFEVREPVNVIGPIVTRGWF